MASKILPPQRREVVVRGDGNNCLYRAIALWRDEISDELLFASNSVEDHVKESKITGTWAETVDIFSCASLFKRPICHLLIIAEKMVQL